MKQNTIPRTTYFLAFFLLICFCVLASGQVESLTNAQIIEMAKAGLGEDIILNKIKGSNANFDVSAAALIEMKKAGVSDAIISMVMEKSLAKELLANATANTADTAPAGYSDSQSFSESAQFPRTPVTPKEALENAKTIALVKASLNPSRQALEKEMMKRPEWKKFNLSIERYKDHADLFVEIGFVPLSLITHRYVYRIYDRRSGTVIAAGETTSWGSLAHNLAKHICKSLRSIAG